jgi:hypothetical protein
VNRVWDAPFAQQKPKAFSRKLGGHAALLYKMRMKTKTRRFSWFGEIPKWVMLASSPIAI